MREVNKIDLSSVVIKRTYAVSKNKLRYLSGIDILTEESSKNYINKSTDRKSVV